MELNVLQYWCELKQEYLLNLEKKLALLNEGYANKSPLQKIEVELDRIRTIEEISKAKLVLKYNKEAFVLSLAKKLELGC